MEIGEKGRKLVYSADWVERMINILTPITLYNAFFLPLFKLPDMKTNKATESFIAILHGSLLRCYVLSSSKLLLLPMVGFRPLANSSFNLGDNYMFCDSNKNLPITVAMCNDNIAVYIYLEIDFFSSVSWILKLCKHFHSPFMRPGPIAETNLVYSLKDCYFNNT